MQSIKSYIANFKSKIIFKFKNNLFLDFDNLSDYLWFLRYLLPEYNAIHSLVFVISSFITLNLFLFDYNQLAIIFYCFVWFLNVQFSATDKNKLIEEIMNNQKKRKTYQEEIIKIIQSRYLLVNESVNNFEWLNFIIKIKWTRFIKKLFQHEINQIVYSSFIDDKFSFKKNEKLFRGIKKSNEVVIKNSAYRFDTLILEETKPPVLHEVRKGTSMRKDEIVFQLKVQFWVSIIVHDTVKDEKTEIQDLEFLGSAKLRLVPLINKYPFIGGFTFYFNEKLIFCSNSSLNLLGLKDNQSDELKYFIEQKVNQILNNQIYKINGRFIEETIYQKFIFYSPTLLCYINLIEIINLDSVNSSNNFTYFCLIKLGEIIHQTKSIKNTVSPKFNETFIFPVHDFDEYILIKLFARKYENDDSICIGKLRINLPAKKENVNDLETYLRNSFKFSSTFRGVPFWIPFKIRNHTNRLPFLHLKIGLMNSIADSTKLIDRTLVQLTEHQNNSLPIMIINIVLNNIQLDFSKHTFLTKLNREQLFCVVTNFGGNYHQGEHFFVKNNTSPTGNKIRDVKFCLIGYSTQTINDLNFEIELLNLNGSKEPIPGKAVIKLNDFILSKKNYLAKNISFQSYKLSNKANPINYATAELYLSQQTILIHDLVLENLLFTKIDELNDEHLKPQNINSISYFSSYLEKIKQTYLDKELNEFIPDLQFKTKKFKKLKRESSKEIEKKVKDEDKKDDCEILLVFHYPSNQFLLVDVIRLINVPVFSKNTLPNPTLLIEMWKDKSRIAYSLTETKYQTRDPFYSIQIQFEISVNKLSNLFLRILILEHVKKTNFISKDKSQFLAESFIQIPELEVGNSSEPKWYKFNRIGIF